MYSNLFISGPSFVFGFFLSPFIRTYFLLLDIMLLILVGEKDDKKKGPHGGNIRPKTVGCLNYAALLL